MNSFQTSFKWTNSIWIVFPHNLFSGPLSRPFFWPLKRLNSVLRLPKRSCGQIKLQTEHRTTGVVPLGVVAALITMSWVVWLTGSLHGHNMTHWSEGFLDRDIWFLCVMVHGSYQIGRVVGTSLPKFVRPPLHTARSYRLSVLPRVRPARPWGSDGSEGWTYQQENWHYIVHVTSGIHFIYGPYDQHYMFSSI